MFFGEFIRQKRLDLDIEAKEIARLLSLSPQYIVDLEKGRRNPPDGEMLNKLIDILQLSEEERHTMFDLAGKARDIVPYDISAYVKNEDMAKVALRTAKNMHLSEEFWQKVNEMAKQEGVSNENDL